MATTLVRSEIELLTQAQLAEEITISSQECTGKFLFKGYSAICHLQSLGQVIQSYSGHWRISTVMQQGLFTI